jgi:hypothetical protein
MGKLGGRLRCRVNCGTSRGHATTSDVNGSSTWLQRRALQARGLQVHGHSLLAQGQTRSEWLTCTPDFRFGAPKNLKLLQLRLQQPA